MPYNLFHTRSLSARRPGDAGIAIGPILFIVAILAVLATAIAAGSGTFSAGSEQEKARSMASEILSICTQYRAAVQRMTALGCNIRKLDYRPNTAWPSGTAWTYGDYTGGNGTNKSGTGQCALFDARGGGLNWQRLPAEALASTLSGGFTGDVNCNGACLNNIDAFAGYPWLMGGSCLRGHGTCQSSDSYANEGALAMVIDYLNYNTCNQINKQLGITTDANSLTMRFSAYWADIFANYNLRTVGEFVYRDGVFTGSTYYPQGCGRNAWGSAVYSYLCPIMIR